MTRSDKSDSKDYMRCYICGSPYTLESMSYRDNSGFLFCEPCHQFVRFAHNILTSCAQFGICHPKGRVR